MQKKENTGYKQTDSPLPHQALFDALPQQVAEEGQSVVQLHLFVVESQTKGHGAQRIPAQPQSQNPPQGKAQTHSVVPDSVKVNIVLKVSPCIQVEVNGSMCWDKYIIKQQLVRGQFRSDAQFAHQLFNCCV